MSTRALIVDDEYPARAELRFLLSEFDDVQVVGEATNAEEALTLITSLRYDVVFLDIRMPGRSGLDIASALREMPQRPKVIFTTAYPDHAVAAFDLEAADYLVKPFDSARLRRALGRALGSSLDDSDGRSAGGDDGRLEPFGRIPVQRDGRTILVEPSAIIYASAARGYSYLQLADERLLVSFSLNVLERRLHGHFFRTHRSYLVNLDHVRELVPDFKGSLVLIMDDPHRSRVDVSRRHARDLRELLGM